MFSKSILFTHFDGTHVFIIQGSSSVTEKLASFTRFVRIFNMSSHTCTQVAEDIASFAYRSLIPPFDANFVVL